MNNLFKYFSTIIIHKMSETSTPFYIKRLNKNAKIPVKGSVKAAGYDIYSNETLCLPAKGKALIKTGLSIAVPTGNYGRIGKFIFYIEMLSTEIWIGVEEFH